MRADHSIARTQSSFDAKRGTSARTRASPGLRAQISSTIRSTPSGAELRSAVMTSNVRSSGTHATTSTGSKSVSAHSRAKASHTSGANRSTSKVASTSARAASASPSRYATCAAGDAGRRDRAREPGIGRVDDPCEHGPCPFEVVELQAGPRLRGSHRGRASARSRARSRPTRRPPRAGASRAAARRRRPRPTPGPPDRSRSRSRARNSPAPRRHGTRSRAGGPDRTPRSLTAPGFQPSVAPRVRSLLLSDRHSGPTVEAGLRGVVIEP